MAMAVLALAALPAPSFAHESSSTAAAEALLAPGGCPTGTDGGDPIQPDQVITGAFGSELQGSYVMLPFKVPAGTDAVRVKYCYDQPENALPSQLPNAPRHTLDLGLYQGRSGPADLWDTDEFRGWGGSSHPDVTVSPNGFSTEAEYLQNPQLHRRGHTTRGFLPGPIPRGEWAVELGLASIVPESEGDATGEVSWRVEIDTIRSRDYRNQRHEPAAYDSTPANSSPGWYAGDLHVHSEHSNLGAAPMSETFDYAFGPLAPGPDGGAGLDFITLSDYVTTSAWGEIGRYQPAHPGKLIIRSSEVITYRGHANNHASLRWADYRTGRILERRGDGSLTPLREPRPASTIFDTVHDGGGFTQINHPTIFPSQVPGFAGFCRGCPWDYSDAETDYSKVDAIELATGPAGLKTEPYPGPNPFTTLAIQFYEHALDTGARVAAVGSSDSHTAGRDSGNVSDVTGAPIGMATTVVYADELSERGIVEGVRAGHTYVKVWGNDGPDLRFSADDPASPDDPAIMGDTVAAGATQFHARVIGAGPGAARPGLYSVEVIKDGLPILTVPVPSDDFSFDFPSAGEGRYRLQVMRYATGLASIENISSPIYLQAGTG